MVILALVVIVIAFNSSFLFSYCSQDVNRSGIIISSEDFNRKKNEKGPNNKPICFSLVNGYNATFKIPFAYYKDTLCPLLGHPLPTLKTPIAHIEDTPCLL